ncbi:MAG: 50S ribosomal protein L18e [Euryarchaeota archaeon]|nr:50S ribosomal protein L18e [Euryarchaeota archaeon]
MPPTGPTNPRLRRLIVLLQRKSRKEKAAIWKDLSRKLERPSRKRAEVNISRIARFTNQNSIVVIPGKVLGAGTIKHPVTVAAVKFSKEAKRKIEAAGGQCLPIEFLLDKNPKGSRVTIME